LDIVFHRCCFDDTYMSSLLHLGHDDIPQPSSKPLEQLEFFQKRILKQILSLPMSCPDPAVYTIP
jgi:hypothetical protein